jgi:polygalacturonase
MGSETSAGIRHVFAENCQVDGPDSAIRLKSTRGRGGGIENVFVRNVTANKTLRYAITIDMMYSKTQPAPKSETTPVFKNIYIDGFTCESAPQAIYIMGLEESPVENVTLKNIKVKGNKGAHIEKVKGFVRENVEVTPATGEAWELKDVNGGV